jgi:hypothetical protein
VIYFYRAYGLALSSDTVVPTLREERSGPKVPDLAMSFGTRPNWVQDALRLPRQIGRPRPGGDEGHDSPFTFTTFGAGEFFELAYGDGTRFIVDGLGRRLWGTWPSPLTPEDAATYLLGPVMGFVFRRRSVLALHGSSVCVSGNAVMLCGSSESGKSTTAAALALRGIPVLTDDISPVREDKGSLYIEPGYPRVCLWPEAVGSLLGAPEALPRITPTWEKCFLALDGVSASFESKKRPLAVVYLLAARVDEVDAPRIQGCRARDALLELVQNTYMNGLLDRNQRAAEFDVLSRLVANVPVRRIVPHADPAGVGVLCELILRDVESSLGRQSSAVVDCER